MPGGVSSPVRAFKSVGGGPVVFDKVDGQHCYDVDGNKYIDYVGTWGPAICGHNRPEVNAALVETLKKGTSFGAPSLNENVLAKMVIDAVPSVEMVRFTNSGTEACMGMLRLMRAYTGRDKIIKFEGCYHGHADGFLPDAIFPDWSAHRPRWRYNGYADFDPARYHALALGAAAEPASARALARLVGAGASGLTAALLHAVGLRRRAAGPGAPHPTPLPPPY